MMLFFRKRKESKIIYIFIIFRRRLDVSSIRSGAGDLRHFSMTMVSYGYFGDLMRRSERWKELNLFVDTTYFNRIIFQISMARPLSLRRFRAAHLPSQQGIQR